MKTIQSNRSLRVIFVFILICNLSFAQTNTITSDAYYFCIGDQHSLLADIGSTDHIGTSANWLVLSSTATYTLTPQSTFDWRYADLTITSPGTVSIVVRYAIGGVDQNIDTTAIRTFSAISTQINGPGELCINSYFNYSAFISAPTIDNYTWTFPSGITLDGNNSPFTTGQSINLNVGSSASSGDICVIVNGTGCSISPTSCIYGRVSSRIPNKPGVITATVDALACPGFGWILSIVPVADATFYNWSCTNSNYFVLDYLVGTDSNFLNIVGQGYYKSTAVSVNAANGCGESADRNKNLTSWTQDVCGGARKSAPEPEVFQEKTNKIFYNSSNKKLIIDFQTCEFSKIKIFNSSGELAYFENNTTKHYLEVDGHFLVNGFYFALVESDSGLYRLKFLIMN